MKLKKEREFFLSLVKYKEQIISNTEPYGTLKIINNLIELKYPIEFKDKKTIFDDSKIESHSALTPTYKIPKLSTLSVSISDALSGIDTYNAYLNGEWILMEYDYKTKKLVHNLKDGKVISGKNDIKKLRELNRIIIKRGCLKSQLTFLNSLNFLKGIGNIPFNYYSTLGNFAKLALSSSSVGM